VRSVLSARRFREPLAPSDSVHGSWNESLDFNLAMNDDGTHSTYPFYQPVDVRFVTPILRLTNDPDLLWLKRIECKDKYVEGVFRWIEKKLTNACFYHLRMPMIYANHGSQTGAIGRPCLVMPNVEPKNTFSIFY
jgi:hypothetical protein